MENLLAQEQVQEFHEEMQRGPAYQTDMDLDAMLDSSSPEQRFVYESILQEQQGIYLVHGGAGVGKSYLLRMLKLGLENVVLKLAPTGVSANTIGGQTLYRFLGITIYSTTNNRYQTLIDLLDEHLKRPEGRQKLVLLIDKVSMISKSLLETVPLFSV